MITCKQEGASNRLTVDSPAARADHQQQRDDHERDAEHRATEARQPIQRSRAATAEDCLVHRRPHDRAHCDRNRNRVEPAELVARGGLRAEQHHQAAQHHPVRGEEGDVDGRTGIGPRLERNADEVDDLADGRDRETDGEQSPGGDDRRVVPTQGYRKRLTVPTMRVRRTRPGPQLERGKARYSAQPIRPIIKYQRLTPALALTAVSALAGFQREIGKNGAQLERSVALGGVVFQLTLKATTTENSGSPLCDSTVATRVHTHPSYCVTDIEDTAVGHRRDVVQRRRERAASSSTRTRNRCRCRSRARYLAGAAEVRGCSAGSRSTPRTCSVGASPSPRSNTPTTLSWWLRSIRLPSPRSYSPLSADLDRGRRTTRMTARPCCDRDRRRK